MCVVLSSSQMHANTSEDLFVLEDYVVSAGPGLRSVNDFAAPVQVVTEKTLTRKASSTLAATLEGEPGISASSYGAGASRPILRGFDGPRVRILDAGIEAFDVSDSSPDHAVVLEPLLLERVEILRGPATLLYGGSAIGGAINVVDKSIPRKPVADGQLEGAFEARIDSVSEGKTFVGNATLGGDDWALSLTGLDRSNKEYEVPDHETPKLEGSFQETKQYSIGATRFFGTDAHFGVAFSRYKSDYGVPGHHHEEEAGTPEPEEEEEGVAIDLKANRIHAELEMSAPFSWAEALRLRASYNDYQHAEIEDGSIAAFYDRAGWEIRGELAHSAWKCFDTGLIGLQFSHSDFEVLGDEAFVPPSETKTQSLFINEHWHGETLHYELGGRVEQMQINAEGAAEEYSDAAFSIAASAIWEMKENQFLKLSLQRSQRHPNATELYADGAHLATSQFQAGNAALGVETAYGMDLSYEWKLPNREFMASVFYTRFNDYIYDAPLGYQIDDEGRQTGAPGFEADHALDAYAFGAVDANFYGLESEFIQSLYRSAETEVRLRLMGDLVRAEERSSGESLPRIPPVRLGIGIEVENPEWFAGLEIKRSFEQNETGANESATAGYTQVGLNLSKQISLSANREITCFVRADNLLDEKIVHHTSYLKEEAPLPGRNFNIGLRMDF